MVYRPGSLKSKIIFGYISGLLIVLLFTSFILINLIFLEERIRFFEVVTRFVDTVFEARRYEKNYFLYKMEEDFQKALQYIKNAINLVQSNRNSFDAIEISNLSSLDKQDTSDVAIEMLTEYKMLLQSSKTGSSHILARVRESGHRLTALAEEMAEAERRFINKTIRSTKHSLIISVGIFFIGTVAIAFIVSTIIIKPLKEIEQSMDRIASGRFEMLSISSEDKEVVSLRKAFERMIKEIFSQRDIIRSEKLTSLGTMLAGIAHEINNPLNNISTSAEILKEEIETPDLQFKRELLQQIISETDRAKDVVLSILEYTRDKDFKKTEIGIQELINGTLRFIRNDFPPHITLSVNIKRDIHIHVDKQKFQHALLNIIKNAIEAMEDRMKEGRLTIEVQERGSSWVEIIISDTGPGIPEDIIGKIFDPFFTTKKGKGTGLGLFITHYIIQQHNGSISVESTPGRGTTFTIKLPLERGQQ